MNRRAATKLALALALAGAASPLLAQSARAPFRIGLLPELNAHERDVFVAAMREQNWLKDRDFVLVEPAAAAVRPRQVPSATKRASEEIGSMTKLLVEQKPDVILATSTAYALAVQRVSRTVPVVMWTSGYPVEAGIAERLARPGKNVTGNSIYAGTGMWGKLVELLHEAKPGIKRIAVLWDYVPPAFVREEIVPAHDELLNAAAKLHVGMQIIEVASSAEAEAALGALGRQSIDGLIITSGWGLSQRRAEVMRFATERRIPVIVDFRWPASIDPYPLLVYGASEGELMRTAALYTVRILKGASAAELPINLPTKFDLVINLRTAAALGLKLPMPLRLQAAEVIE
jgi:putative ABC transport system substrate-binding protein